MKLNQLLIPILNRQKSPKHIAAHVPAQAYFSQIESKNGSRNGSKKVRKQKSPEDR